MLFILVCLLVFGFALLTTSLLRIASLAEYLVTMYLLASANVILVGEIAGTFGALNNQFVFLVLHLLLLGLSFYLWWRKGKLSIFGPFANFREEIKGNWLNVLRRWPDLALLSAGVIIAYLIGAFLILKVAPNTADAMGTYLARVGYWLQHGSFEPWPTAIWPQVSYPFNAQIQILWTVLFWGTDQFAGFVQWAAAVASILAIIGLARTLGWSPPQAFFAGMIWATFPEIILQSTSTQNDLVTASFFVCMVYLFFAGMQFKNRWSLSLSGLALGLALGAKHVILLLIPGLIVGIFLIWLLDIRTHFRPLVFWAFSCIAGIILVGGYSYAFNMVHFKAPLGPKVDVTNVYGDEQPPTTAEIARHTLTQIFRILYQMPDMSGIPNTIGDVLHEYKTDAAEVMFSYIDLPIQTNEYVTNYATSWAFDLQWRPTLHEHHGWYGPVSFLILFPAVIIQAWFGLRKRDPYRLGLIAMGLSALFFVSYRRYWGGVEGRYLIIGLTVIAPLAACFVKKGTVFKILRWMVVLLAVFIAIYTATHNALKPVVGPNAIWGLNRIEEQTIHYKGHAPTVAMVQELVPAGSTIAFARFPFDYYLFGEKFEFNLVPIVPLDQLDDPEWVRENEIDAILNCSGRQVSAPEYGVVGISGAGNLCELSLKGAGDNFALLDQELKESLTRYDQMPVKRPIIRVADELAEWVSIGPGLFTSSRALGDCGTDRSCLWLAKGEDQGFRSMLWAEDQVRAFVVMRLSKGPDAEKNSSLVKLQLTNQAGKIEKEVKVTAPVDVLFDVVFEPGANELSVVVDNGEDTSSGGPLQVFLQNITVNAPFYNLAAGPEELPLVQIHGSVEAVAVDKTLVTPWNIETDEDGSWLWLGHGPGMGLSGTLLAESETQIKFVFDVYPGPSRDDARRTVELTVTHSGEIQQYQQSFDSDTQLVFDVTLKPGENDFAFSVLDEPNQANPNGDPRPLLVCVKHLQIVPAGSE